MVSDSGGSRTDISVTTVTSETDTIEARDLGKFVSSHLARPGCRLIHIATSPYAVGRWLAERGHEVDIIDPSGSSADAVDGSDSIQVCTPDAIELEAFAYDAAIVSSALHVFRDVSEIARRIAKSLVSGGLIVLEEPDASALRSDVSNWYRLALQELRDRRYIELSTDDDLERAVFAGRSIAEYLEQRGQHVHVAVSYRAAVRADFKLLSDSACPYLYRYFARIAPSSESGQRLLESFYRLECDAIEKGLLAPSGRRIVAVSAG